MYAIFIKHAFLRYFEQWTKERGWESPNSNEGTYTVVLYFYKNFVPRPQPGPEGDAEHAVRERHTSQLCQLDGIRRANYAGQSAPHLGLAPALLHGSALG